MPYLSIIVPVYNKVDYLNECIQSILSQTFTDFQLILVNDGSIDGSAEMCDKLALSDNRIRVIHQANGGVSSARNTGLSVATGVFIGFVDSDDLLEPDMYQILLDNAFKFDADISMCGVTRVISTHYKTHGEKNTVQIFNKNEGISALLTGVILLSNYDKIFRATVVKGIRFEPALFEDTYYNFEALKSAERSVFDDRIKYRYMIRDSSHSLSPFGRKYMNTISITRRMMHVCASEFPHLINEAKSFDFTQNFIVLNMILHASKKRYVNEYNVVVTNLKKYSGHYSSAKNIIKRHKFGYGLFRISSRLYSIVLTLYGVIMKTDNRKRTQKLKNW